MDISDVFSGAALVLAVVSPFVTSVVNSYTQKREREAVFYLQRQADVFEEYVCRAGQCIKSPTQENLSAYGSAFGKTVLDVDYETAKEMQTLDELLSGDNDLAKTNYLRAIAGRLVENNPRLVHRRRNKNTK